MQSTTSSADSQRIIYFDPMVKGGKQDGSSWENAFSDWDKAIESLKK